MEHPDYYRLREQLIDFLEERSHHRPSRQRRGGRTPLRPPSRDRAARPQRQHS